MKKILTVIALCITCAFMFTACDSGKKEATQCLKEHLKCPETLKVDSISVSEQEEAVFYDTMYYVTVITGQKYQYIDAYASIDSITYDSVKILKTVFPAYKKYVFSYNAQNGFGAMVHGTEIITCVCDTYMTFDEYFSIYYDNVTIDTCYAEHVAIPASGQLVIQLHEWIKM